MPEMYEIRSADLWPDADYEIRSAAEGFNFEGYVAVYDSLSKPLAFPGVNRGRPFREILNQGAFTKTLSELPDVTLRYQHNMLALPLGRTRAGTLTLTEDGRGLRAQALLPDNEWGRPVRDAVARGDISGMSFRFKSVRGEFRGAAGGVDLRTLSEVMLGPEVSITDVPAFPDTTASVRSLAEAVEVQPEELAAAMRALRDLDAPISPDQFELLRAVVNRRAAMPASPCCDACGDTTTCCTGGDCPDGCDGTSCDACSCIPARSEPIGPTPEQLSHMSDMRSRLAELARS